MVLFFFISGRYFRLSGCYLHSGRQMSDDEHLIYSIDTSMLVAKTDVGRLVCQTIKVKHYKVKNVPPFSVKLHDFIAPC